MFAADRASRETMGMELLACEPGRAVMRMAVRALHLNGHQICHGGFIFTLADSTFAFACNSRNHNTVAAGCSIEFAARARRRRADLRGRGAGAERRHGVYDMRVSNQHGHASPCFAARARRSRAR
jgi:acyl-CoA thioesterase